MAFWEPKPQQQEQKIIQQPGKMLLVETKFKYITGHLYYTKANENGFICLWQTPVSHKGRVKKVETSTLQNDETVNENIV